MSQALISLDELNSYAKGFLRDFPEATVVGLSGELGAGKTTFVRTIVENLAAKGKAPKVVSPTFTLHQTFSLSRPIEHFDLYRLEMADRVTLIEIGYYDALERARGANGLVFVEWPTQAKDSRLLELDVLLDIQIEKDARRFRLTKSGTAFGGGK